jgi:uncharacterized protein
MTHRQTLSNLDTVRPEQREGSDYAACSSNPSLRSGRTEPNQRFASKRNVGEVAALGLIKAYQYGIRPMLGQRCRFFPSCSEYTADAIGVYGVLRGSAMGAMRLAKCHPWHAGGYDPVPEKSTKTPLSAAATTAQPASTNP